MNKIYKIFRKMMLPLLAAIVLCCTNFNANAQCGNITVTANVTASTCFGAPTLQLTVSGSGVQYIVWDDAGHPAQVVLTTAAGTVMAPLNCTAVSPPTGGGTIIYSVPSGSLSYGVYKLNFSAYCHDGNYYGTLAAPQITVNFTNNYVPMSVNAVQITPSLTPGATGVMQISVTSGVSPYTYTLTQTSGSGYGGSTGALSPNPFGVNNLPAGTYLVTVTDACGGSTLKGVTIGTTSGGTPPVNPPGPGDPQPQPEDLVHSSNAANINTAVGRPLNNNTCNVISPINDIFKGYDYYLTNGFYEYVYSNSSTLPGSGWATLTTRKPTYTIPSGNYNSFCTSTQLWFAFKAQIQHLKKPLQAMRYNGSLHSCQSYCG